MIASNGFRIKTKPRSNSQAKYDILRIENSELSWDLIAIINKRNKYKYIKLFLIIFSNGPFGVKVLREPEIELTFVMRKSMGFLSNSCSIFAIIIFSSPTSCFELVRASSIASPISCSHME